MLGNSQAAHNTLKALAKTQQHVSAVIEHRNGNSLTESTAVLNRWTEYCSGLYIYELHPNTGLLQRSQPPHKRLKAYRPLLKEDAEKTLHSLKAGKSQGVDNRSDHSK